VEGVTKRYGRLLAVDRVTVALPRGRALGLVGPNGSGKTTLIKSCVGILRPDGGHVRIHGFDMGRQGLRAKSLIAYAPEFPDPVPQLTPRDHLAFCGQALGIPDWEANAERLLHLFDMLDKGDRKCSSLSKGERQKTMLALAFLRRPLVLFLDEPLIGLDPRAALALKHEVRALLAAGGSAVISSHVLSLVAELCSEVAVMSQGNLVFHGTTGQLMAAAPEGPGKTLEGAFMWMAAPGDGRRF
jgi:ABC-type multidrug transport system ATPase subunit